MPTFTAITLDRLLEPGSRNPSPKPPLVPVRQERSPALEALGNKKIPRPYASPALYATPEATPLPDSPSSFPPSPYIINHKRRGPRLLKTLSQSDVGVCQPAPDAGVKDDAGNGIGREGSVNGHDGNHEGERDGQDERRKEVQGTLNGFHDRKSEESLTVDVLVGHEELTKSIATDQQRDGEREDFLDFQDSMSISSNTEADDSNGLDRSLKPTTPHGEFFDAFEEISSEGASQLSSRDIEKEMHEIKLNLLMEIERRQQAEEALENLQNRWQRLCDQLSHVGLKLPAAPTFSEEQNEQSDIDPAEQLCQQVALARFVAETVGRGCSRAEVELEMEPLIESKNFEIARLCDRLHYYEAANREMSQRNQEAVEMARQERHRRKRRQKWFWTSMGLAVTLGVAAIGWSYLPVSMPSSHDGQVANQP